VDSYERGTPVVFGVSDFREPQSVSGFRSGQSRADRSSVVNKRTPEARPAFAKRISGVRFRFSIREKVRFFNQLWCINFGRTFPMNLPSSTLQHQPWSGSQLRGGGRNLDPRVVLISHLSPPLLLGIGAIQMSFRGPWRLDNLNLVDYFPPGSQTF
jgi:hypothetical protein